MAPKANDKKTLNAWLRGLAKQGLVISAPTAGDERTVVDGHTDVAELLDRKKLARDTTNYVFWNRLGEYERGELIGDLFIYWGGDRGQIHEILARTLPAEFVLGGGSNDDEAFMVRRRFDIDDLDWNDGAAVNAVVDRLERGGMSDSDRPRRNVNPPHNVDELQFLADVLRKDDLGGPARSRAFNLLASSKALSDDLLDLAASDPAAVFKVGGKWLREVPELIAELMRAGRQQDAERLALQVAEEVVAARPEASTTDDDVALADDVLIGCPTSATLAAAEAAEAADLVRAAVRIHPRVTGEPIYPYAVQKLSELLAADTLDEYPRFKFTLFYLQPAPEAGELSLMSRDLSRRSILGLLDAAEPGTQVREFLVDRARGMIDTARRDLQYSGTPDEDRAVIEELIADLEQVIAGDS